MLNVSRRVQAAANSFEPIRHFYFHSRYAERRNAPDISDFTFGNPHEMPLPGLVEALQRHAVPHNKDWFAYKTSDSSVLRRSWLSASARNCRWRSSLPTSH